jgi:hypothetical protein
MLGIVYLFLAGLGPAWALLGVAAVYGAEIWADNVFARLTWRLTVASAWIVTAAAGATNLMAVFHGRAGAP